MEWDGTWPRQMRHWTAVRPRATDCTGRRIPVENFSNPWQEKWQLEIKELTSAREPRLRCQYSTTFRKRFVGSHLKRSVHLLQFHMTKHLERQSQKFYFGNQCCWPCVKAPICCAGARGQLNLDSVAKSLWVINFSAAYDLRHYQHVDRLLKSVPTPPRYQYLLVTRCKNTHQKPVNKNTKRKRVTWRHNVDRSTSTLFLAVQLGEIQCHASQLLLR